jgi:hypothetical protein
MEALLQAGAEVVPRWRRSTSVVGAGPMGYVYQASTRPLPPFPLCPPPSPRPPPPPFPSHTAEGILVQGKY